MPRYILIGDITHAGRVTAEGATLEDAIQAASDGDFEVLDEDNKNLGFDFCGDTDGGAELDTDD
jgi:hypothetical protein